MRFLVLALVALFAVAACSGGAPSTPAASPVATPATTPAAPTDTPAAPTPAAPTPTEAPAVSPPAMTPDPAESPSGETPVDPSASRACALVSAEEMAAITGSPMIVTEATETACTYSPEGGLFPIYVLRFGSGETIEAGKMIASNGRDLTIGGQPAFYGEFMGGILYVERGGDTLVVQAPLQTDEPVPTQMEQIAELALSRW